MTVSEANRLAAFSRAVRESTLKRLKLVPAGLENWRIAPAAMSFGDLAQHIVDADKWLFEKLKVKKLQPMVGAPGLLDVRNRDAYVAILQELEETGRLRASMLEQMTEVQLAERLFDERFGGDVTVWWVIVRGNLDHEIHHRGAIAAYLAALKGMRQ